MTTASTQRRMATGRITMRAAHESDSGFLRGLHLETHPELTLLPMPVRADVLTMQLSAQRAQYEGTGGATTDEIIELDGLPSGRCWTCVDDRDVRVLDIAVSTDAQGRGVGTAALEMIIGRADRSRRPVRLSVWQENIGAQRLYLALGFVPDVGRNGYLDMTRLPAASPARSGDHAMVGRL